MRDIRASKISYNDGVLAMKVSQVKKFWVSALAVLAVGGLLMACGGGGSSSGSSASSSSGSSSGR